MRRVSVLKRKRNGEYVFVAEIPGSNANEKENRKGGRCHTGLAGKLHDGIHIADKLSTKR
jgi:hypothetical protein